MENQRKHERIHSLTPMDLREKAVKLKNLKDKNTTFQPKDWIQDFKFTTAKWGLLESDRIRKF